MPLIYVRNFTKKWRHLLFSPQQALDWSHCILECEVRYPGKTVISLTFAWVKETSFRGTNRNARSGTVRIRSAEKKGVRYQQIRSYNTSTGLNAAAHLLLLPLLLLYTSSFLQQYPYSWSLRCFYFLFPKKQPPLITSGCLEIFC
jgi:hypothetical protein